MRHVLIDETSEVCFATPYDTEEEAIAAFRKRLTELFADPKHYLDETSLQDWDVASPDDLDDEVLYDLLTDLWIQSEGGKGVWSNFSSGDRWSVSGRWPEDGEFGNADSRHYGTAGRPSGVVVPA